MWHHGYGMMNGYGGTWGIGIGILFWLLAVTGIVVLVVWVVRSSTRRNSGASAHGPDALEIARRRYANGEINKEQFEQIKNDLSK